MLSVELKDICVAFLLHSVHDLMGKKGKWLAHTSTSVRFSAKFNEEAKNKKESIIFLSAFVGFFPRCSLWEK